MATTKMSAPRTYKQNYNQITLLVNTFKITISSLLTNYLLSMIIAPSMRVKGAIL